MKRIAICAALLSAALFGEIKFHALNVRGVDLVTGVTHPEFRTATNALWQAVASKVDVNAAGAVATNVYASMPHTYAATNAVVALNQSVQYAVVNGTEIAITPPSAVAGGIRDWVLYLNGTAETALDLSAFSGLLAADAAYTNAVASNVVTVLYFSEITNGVFHLSRQELTPIK